MIPFVAVVSLRGRKSRTLRIWVPLILLWLFLVPLGGVVFATDFHRLFGLPGKPFPCVLRWLADFVRAK